MTANKCRDKRRKISLPVVAGMKARGEAITMLTAYDASFARRIDQAGVDCVLVGDSLGNVIQGRDSTLPVTIDHMVYHVEAVRRGLEYALLLADLPFMSYHDRASAMDSAARLMRAGAEMVKLEGGSAVVPIVADLVAQGVPVCGHLGLTPQHVHQLGGYRVQGREQAAAEQLRMDARDLAAAGAAMLVLECVPGELARSVAAEISIPVIGIGAGAEVDGQVLVLYDVLGISTGHRPRFVKDFMDQAGSIDAALAAFVEAVRAGSFPGPEHGYS
jgi:3-methyl-2-oxobutanoate hydroxymethyltransferase